MNSVGHAVEEEPDDGWGGLSHVHDDSEDEDASRHWELVEGNPEEVISEGNLPFVRIKTTPEDPEEEQMDAIQRGRHPYYILSLPGIFNTILQWKPGLSTFRSNGRLLLC